MSFGIIKFKLFEKYIHVAMESPPGSSSGANPETQNTVWHMTAFRNGLDSSKWGGSAPRCAITATSSRTTTLTGLCWIRWFLRIAGLKRIFERRARPRLMVTEASCMHGQCLKASIRNLILHTWALIGVTISQQLGIRVYVYIYIYVCTYVWNVLGLKGSKYHYSIYIGPKVMIY